MSQVKPLPGRSHVVNRQIVGKIKVLRVLIMLVGFIIASPANSDTYDYGKLSDKRQRYITALSQLTAGKMTEFNQSLDSLQDYPLYPYLEYEQLDRTMKRLPKQQVRQFIEKYDHFPVGQKMTFRWLNLLIKKNQWQQLVDDWDPAILDTRLRCWHLRAKYRIGKKREALEAVQPIWLSSRSLPKACDPLFKEWIAEGYLTQDIAWQRLTLAVEAGRTKLARYIVRKLLTGVYADLGSEYLKAHRYPDKLGDMPAIKQIPARHSDKVSQIIAHGVKRLARKDPQLAVSRWQKYQSDLVFSEQQIASVELALSSSGQVVSVSDSTETVDASIADESPSAIEHRIRTALHKADWSTVTSLIQILPADYQARPRWRYWLARSLEIQERSLQDVPTPQNIYQELSKNRSYYGFLAADLIDADYAMEDQPAAINPETTRELSNNKAIVTALELFAVGQIGDARREWRFGARNLDAPMLLAAGKLADTFGWHEKAIRSYIQAQYWDDLQARFPLAYKNKMMDASKSQDIESSLLFAIARQESAFSPDAKSRAGALGLMQLMPRTAKQTAKQIGLAFKKSDLLKPDTNIHLGSNYLKALLKEFDGNRILAATAYNAGPHRVKSWLNKSNKNLPFDAWIETIPFKETRSYVQNVLAFSVIYDYRMEQSGQLVTESEASQML